MNLKELGKLLKEASDAIYAVIGSEIKVRKNETSTTAKKILKSVKRKKMHWTQNPRNKAKMLKNIRNMVKKDKRR